MGGGASGGALTGIRMSAAMAEPAKTAPVIAPISRIFMIAPPEFSLTFPFDLIAH
jgi:hypothetical protein